MTDEEILAAVKRLHDVAERRERTARADLASELTEGYAYPTHMEAVAIAQFELSWWKRALREPARLEQIRTFAFTVFTDLISDSASAWHRAERHSEQRAAKRFWEMSEPDTLALAVMRAVGGDAR